MVYRFIGIDPGKTGWIVVLDEKGNIVSDFATPMVGKEYDVQSMKNILQQYAEEYHGNESHRLHLVLENVHATQMGGKVSNFDFGRGKGLWEGLIAGLEIPSTQVNPKEWQKWMWQGVKKQYKTGKKKRTVDTKLTSLLAAKSLKPDQEWKKLGVKGQPLKDYNDGLVDAYLMAEYCRRKFK